MRVGNKLTAIAVRNANEPGLYGDGHGLYLQVSTFITKAWIFRYMIDGLKGDFIGVRGFVLPQTHGQRWGLGGTSRAQRWLQNLLLRRLQSLPNVLTFRA